MNDELDLILLEQLHQARKNKKKLKRLRKLLRNDPAIDKGEAYIDGRINFYETMINDKTLLNKKHKKKRNKDPDILARGVVYEWYRNIFFTTTLGYRLLMEYMSNFKKGKQ